MGEVFKGSKESKQIYLGEIFITYENGNYVVNKSDGTNLSNAQQETYLRAQSKMNARVVSLLGSTYANQVVDEQTFKALWEKLEVVVLGEKSTKLLELQLKLYKVKGTAL